MIKFGEVISKIIILIISIVIELEIVPMLIYQAADIEIVLNLLK